MTSGGRADSENEESCELINHLAQLYQPREGSFVRAVVVSWGREIYHNHMRLCDTATPTRALQSNT